MMPMTYDLDFRYRRALQPEGLSTVQTAVQAVEDAIKDARNAGLDPERDPAVTLLARHLGRLASPPAADDTASADRQLRAQCLERIAELKTKPAIVALVRRGVDYEPEAKRAFRCEAARALRHIAAEIGLAHDQYSIHCDSDQIGPAGDVTLASEAAHLRITATAFRAGREVTYRRSRSRHDEFGGPLHHADIGRLSDIPRLARQIERDLGLAERRSQNRLFPGD
jgi:hypothetical protein